MGSISIILVTAVALLGCSLAFPEQPSPNTDQADNNRPVGTAENTQEEGSPNYLQLETTESFITILGAFNSNLRRDIAKERNRTKRSALTQVQRTLSQVQAKARPLPNVVKNAQKQRDADTSRSEKTITGRWSKWSDAQLKRVQDYDQIATASSVLNEFTTKSNDELTKCVEESEKELTDYQTEIDGTVKPYQTALNTLIKNVQTCKSNTDTAKDTELCVTGTKTELAQLQKSTAAFDALVARGKTLQRAKFQNRTCASTAVFNFDIEKADVQEKIDQIIAGTYSGDATTTQNPNV